METGTRHILVIAYPAQGHINPLLQFSKRLASMGLRVTFVTTSSISKSMQAGQTASSVSFESISDGSEEGESLESKIASLEYRFRERVSQSLAEFIIEKHNSSEIPPKFLVYDSIMPWALDVARQCKLDGAPFFTQPCAVNVIYYHAQQGAFRMPLERSFVSLPSMPTLGIDDMPSFFGETTSHPALLNTLVNQFSNIQDTNWIFCNTFHELEYEVGTGIGHMSHMY